MKKLILSTALVGSLVSGMSVANAATSITGNLAISYFATSNDSSASVNTSKSYNGFGSESQINLAASGDLNNGLKYAAGFSWEIDGTEQLGGSDKDNFNASHEGTYIEFMSGNTTVGVGADRDTSIDGLGVNFVGFGYRPISGVGTSIANTSYGANTAFGFGARQKFDAGTVSFFYAPNSNPASTGYSLTQDIGNSASKSNIDNGENYYSITYAGALSGVNVKAGLNQQTGVSGNTDAKNHGVQVDTSFGKTKVGISRGKSDSSVAIGAAKSTKTTTEVGVAHALSDTVSAGLTYTQAAASTVSNDEIIITASLGYNLGPVSVQLQFKDATDIGGTTGLDAQQLGMYIGTKF